MNNADYRVEIAETSRELTAKERVAAKFTSDCIRLDAATLESVDDVKINPDYWVVLNVHNEKAKYDKDYEQFIVADKDGTRYLTGSKSFIQSFREIMEEMSGTEEPFQIVVNRVDSPNRPGKQFLMASIV